MHIKLSCRTCGEKLDAIGGLTGKDTIEFLIDACECQLPQDTPAEPVILEYDDLLAIVQDRVSIVYHKKNGSYRTMIGYLGLHHDINPGLVYFVERERDSEEAQVKCLLLDGIESVHQIATGLEIRIKGGYFND